MGHSVVSEYCGNTSNGGRAGGCKLSVNIVAAHHMVEGKVAVYFKKERKQTDFQLSS